MADYLPLTQGQSLQVHSRPAALALLDSRARRELDVFRQGPLSAAQVVSATGQPMYRVLRMIHRWEQLGVLKVQEQRRRAGRPVKLYALVAPQFFVPHRVVAVTEVYRMVTAPFQEQMNRYMERAFLEQAKIVGTLVVLSPEQHTTYFAQAPEVPWDTAQEGASAIHDFWLDLHLDYQQARQLREDLEALVQRYGQQSGAQPYRLHLNLVPAPGDWTEE